MNKLSFDEWGKMIREKSPITEEEIESWKNKYYFGINTYEEYKRLMKYEYELYETLSDYGFIINSVESIKGE